MKQIIILVLWSALTIEALAQENYLQGKIVALSGDTINGFIDYRNWEKNPNEIKFKDSNTNIIRTIVSTEINAFLVANEIYEGAIVSVDSLPYKLNELSLSSDFQFRTDKVFLQSIISGSKSLLYYKDRNGREHFFIKEDNRFTLLKFKQYIAYPNDVKQLFTNNAYRNQLTQYLSGCLSLQQASKIEYRKSDLTKAFKDYYTCKGELINYEKKKDKIETEFGILIGIASSRISFESDLFKELVMGNFTSSLSSTFGVRANMVVPRTLGRWSVNNELLYSSYKVEGEYNNFVNAENYEKNKMNIGITYLKVNTLIRFNYPVKRTTTFLNIGLSNGFLIKEINKKDRITKSYGPERTVSGKALNELKKHEFGFIGGVGLKFNDFLAEVRYEKSTGISPFLSLGSSVSRVSFILGYNF